MEQIAAGSRTLTRGAVVLLAAGTVVLTGCARNIPFLPYDDGYETKSDFARLEHELPLDSRALMAITPAYLEGLPQERVDQIYARLTAGPIPDGLYRTRPFVAAGAEVERYLDLMGTPERPVRHIDSRELTTLRRTLWADKLFSRQEGLVRTLLRDPAALTYLTADEADTMFSASGEKAWLLFPAKVYCGQSLLDSRRESIILDHAFNEDIPGYRERWDVLVGRRGLRIRNEIRMVRPGFYLGRAYAGRLFLLNFTLHNEAVPETVHGGSLAAATAQERCWPHTQRR